MSTADPLSILQVISSPWCTGAASATLELACALRDRGHTVRLAAIPGNLLESRAAERGIPFKRFRFNRGFAPLDFLRDRNRLRRLIRETDAQIVHTHLSHDHWAALDACRPPGFPPVVRTFHLARAARGDWLHRSLCYGRTEGFFAVSEQVRNRCLKIARIPERKVTTLRGIVDTGHFRPGRGDSAARDRLGLLSDGPVIGTVSRMAPDRGHFTLLEAFARIRRATPSARLLMTGKGEFREAVLRRAQTLGLEAEVLMPGYWDSDLRGVLGLLDVFVIQSAGSEGTARALLEAMASGLACVVTSRDGLDEIVEDGKSGRVVPPENPQALAQAVVDLLRDPERAQRMGAEARIRAEREFHRDVQAGRTETFYRALLHRTL